MYNHIVFLTIKFGLTWDCNAGSNNHFMVKKVIVLLKHSTVKVYTGILSEKSWTVYQNHYCVLIFSCMYLYFLKILSVQLHDQYCNKYAYLTTYIQCILSPQSSFLIKNITILSQGSHTSKGVYWMITTIPLNDNYFLVVI